ncbi:hypothetical protein [Streptacidiphilus sp. EB129]|uniref:hypothetical protein n=1 Tax=Streptacidiphilus sp. EB129 TaxID=3156262 RepID=UPI0035187BA8
MPSVILLAAAAGERALLGIEIQAKSQHFSPRWQREVRHGLLPADTRAGMATYDRPGLVLQ